MINAVRCEKFRGDRKLLAGALPFLKPKGQHLRFVRQSGVELGNREHELIGAEIFAIGRTFAVVALVAGLQRQHQRAGMALRPLTPGGRDDV